MGSPGVQACCHVDVSDSETQEPVVSQHVGIVTVSAPSIHLKGSKVKHILV